MNTAQKLQEKWNARPAAMARRLGVTSATVRNWLAGGTPKDVYQKLMHIALDEPVFDARALKAKAREKHSATEWLQYLMLRFGDFRLAQFARRLGVRYGTVYRWHSSKEKYLKKSAEALLLYAFLNPKKFPTK